MANDRLGGLVVVADVQPIPNDRLGGIAVLVDATNICNVRLGGIVVVADIIVAPPNNVMAAEMYYQRQRSV